MITYKVTMKNAGQNDKTSVEIEADSADDAQEKAISIFGFKFDTFLVNPKPIHHNFRIVTTD